MITTRKVATYLMIGTLAFTGKTAAVKAAETPEIPLAGITLLLEEAYLTSQNAHEEITQYLMTETASDLAFARVTNYVNIRDKAGESGKILGKLYDRSAATILEKVDGWYKIKSGSVTGYIKADYLITGEKAKETAETTGTKWASVTTTTLKVREKASLDASVLTLVPLGDELKVIKETDGWIKVVVDDNTTGYVSDQYINLRTEYEEAVSIEEEQERLEEEAAAREAEERQSQARSTSRSLNTRSNSGSASSVRSSSTSQKSSSSDVSQESSSEQSSSIRSRLASYAKKFLGNPYVWGGTSLTKGADCSGFTQSVFRNFGISIPRTSRSQAASGKRVSLSNVQPGDLIFYTKRGRINHVAIYIGGGKVIHASSPSTGIRISNYNYRTPYKAVSYIN